MKYKIVLILLAVLAFFSVGCSVYQIVRYFEPPLLQFMLLGYDMPEPFSLSPSEEAQSFYSYGYKIPEKCLTDTRYRPFITQLIGSGLWETYTDCYLDTWYFNLKQDGTLYIMRGLPRKDYDFRERFFMCYVNRFYICKLTREDMDKICSLMEENAELHDPPKKEEPYTDTMYLVNGYMYYDSMVYEAKYIYNYKNPDYHERINDNMHPMRKILYILQCQYPFAMTMEENF